MAAFKRPRNLMDIVARAKLKNHLPMVVLRLVPTPDVCRANKADDFSSPITGRANKIYANTSCIENCIYFINSKYCQKQNVGNGRPPEAHE